MAISLKKQQATIDSRLAAYLAAAGGAGLVAAEQAEAVVVADLTDRPFGVNESVDIDFNGDGVTEFQIDHDRVDLNGSFVDYLQLDKNDFNGALSSTIVQSELAPIDSFSSFPGVPDDYNGDDLWNAADYTEWRDGNSPDSSQAGYDVFADNYGATPAKASKDQGYYSDQLLCGPFTSGGCYPSALTAGSTIGPDDAYEFQEADNAFGNGGHLRTNRLIDEDAGQIDTSFGLQTEAIFDTPRFTGLSGEERFLGVRVDLNDEIYPDNPFPGANGENDIDDPANYVYGWIGVRITNEADATGLVTGFAYETEPGVAILAGDTGTSAVGVPEPTSLVIMVACVVAAMFSFFGRRRQPAIA